MPYPPFSCACRRHPGAGAARVLDDAAGDERIDVGVRVAVLAQHLARVLAQQRRGARDRRRRCGKVDRAAERLGRPGLRMDEVDDHAARERLRMRERLADRVAPDPPARRRRRSASIHSALVRVASTASIRDVSAARFAMRAELVAKRGSSRHSGCPSTSAMRSQFGLVRAADVDPAVAGAKRLVGRGERGAPIRSAPATRRSRSGSPRASTSAAARLPAATCRRSGRGRS